MFRAGVSVSCWFDIRCYIHILLYYILLYIYYYYTYYILYYTLLFSSSIVLSFSSHLLFFQYPLPPLFFSFLSFFLPHSCPSWSICQFKVYVSAFGYPYLYSTRIWPRMFYRSGWLRCVVVISIWLGFCFVLVKGYWCFVLVFLFRAGLT